MEEGFGEDKKRKKSPFPFLPMTMISMMTRPT